MTEHRCDTCRCNKVCVHDRFGFENCENYISEDCVEVIRCRDCKHCVEDIICEGVVYCNEHHKGMRDNNFCSSGERRKDDDV